MAILQIQHRCPHCKELKDFSLSEISEVRTVDVGKRTPPLWNWTSDHPPKRTTTAHGAEFCGLSRCPHCGNPVMFVVETTDVQAKAALAMSGSYGAKERAIYAFEVVQTYPTVEPHRSHPAWPERIRKPFIDVQQMVDARMSPSLILTTCRSVLEVATKELGGEGKTPFERINDLARKGTVTGSVRDWADEVRKRGNAAVHELEAGTDAEARDYVAFIKLFLRVAFELPEEIKGLRARNEAQ
ncbi:DUF4145 domain-containing protein [Phreatobacter stygius]|uniref:DUF4145 domain-containing protein n=1 Tax=Phreatobacter stygius TaxID=1940610 RepID=A0A4D7AZ96_9HYPH|nr:DUF4145 domain-containing protein [Phreatobacter stygius]QCI65651.1 DUF4145 domain-containing protein [Phreatobacter stygius]